MSARFTLRVVAVAAALGGLALVPFAHAEASFPVKVSEGSITIPTYEHTGRQVEPPLFPDSSLTGLYPLTSYLPAFAKGSPSPRTYKTVVLESQYLKLTYIPELGGRFFSLYDKVRHKEVFYRNDVIKPTMFNPRFSWPQSGIELTGPFDAHTLTLHGEPYWSHVVVHHSDGSVSLVLGEIDPIYHMHVNLTATIYPDIAAMQISVFCFNGNDSRMPQMFWTNASFPSTEKTRYIYPMTRTVGHTTGEVTDWPMYNGVDYSWDRNNKHMLGVFGIDAYDNFAGAYQFDHDYGVFRYADRRVVQGMKMWTFGYGPGSEQVQEQYTDHAGPYVEVQSGRHVWDGHYEWIPPHQQESWSEWWIPVSGIGGVTTMSRDVALNLTVSPASGASRPQITVALSPVRAIAHARLVVTSQNGQLLDTEVELLPGSPVMRRMEAPFDSKDVHNLRVRITDSNGVVILDYTRPDVDPGRKQYTPSARELETPRKSPDQMSAEELTHAAEFALKETDAGTMQDLIARALKIDPGYSRAHLLLGIYDYNLGRFADAASEMRKATERDPYSDQGWYYLAISELAQGDTADAERTLYYISPGSSFYGAREYQLGLLALLAHHEGEAQEHFQSSLTANGDDLDSRALLALCLRDAHQTARAATELQELRRINPTSRLAASEAYLLQPTPANKAALLEILGDQTQEALSVAIFYGQAGRWKDAATILHLVDPPNKDPWGTSSLFYYTEAYDEHESGSNNAARADLAHAVAARKVVDRFPSRRESLAPLRYAIASDAGDANAHVLLGELLYSLHEPDQAIEQWNAALQADPNDFTARRSLGLAFAAQGKTSAAVEQLQKAVRIAPDHASTLDDLSAIYARAGRFDDQIALLKDALQRAPDNDDLMVALLNAYLIQGNYKQADEIVMTHNFAPRHRSIILRDEYRNLRYGMGAVAFNHKQFAEALSLFQSALKPPVRLGVDDFQSESTPRAYYYIGRAYEALDEKQEATAAYRQSAQALDNLSGDRDSWSADNFYAVLALDRLGEKPKADALVPRFQGFAETEMNETNPVHRGKARYLLALIAKRAGEKQKAIEYLKDSAAALPDYLPPRYELRGDELDPPGKR